MTSNATQPTISLRISGKVIATPGKFRSRIDLGLVQIDEKQISVGRISNTDIINKAYEIYNKSKEEVKIEISKSPDYLDIKLGQKVLKPKEKTEIGVVFDANKVNKFGNVRDDVFFMINSVESKKSFQVSSYIQMDFSHLSKSDRKNAPKIHFFKNNFDFSALKKNHKKMDEIEIQNNGKNDLTILHIDPTKGIIIHDYPKKLKAKEKSKIFFEIQNKDNLQKLHANIKIYSNDPNKFETNVSIRSQAQQKRSKTNFISARELTNHIKKYNKMSLMQTKTTQLKDTSYAIIDTRSKKLYKASHIPGAINLNQKSKDFKELLKSFDQNSTTYYIYSNDDKESEIFASVLNKHGIKKVKCIKGGMQSWIEEENSKPKK
ncbi:MAG: rhodanese-like domain-containing protein [Candidatus Cloacimonetes bacterium]|nr:rhodanese-like domain-containing protein [Candidatus Cloacimonadota bacterium]